MLVTEWSEFRSIDWRAARGLVRRPIVVDGRNVLDEAALRSAGYAYTGFGRGYGLPAPTSIQRADQPVEAVAEIS